MKTFTLPSVSTLVSSLTCLLSFLILIFVSTTNFNSFHIVSPINLSFSISTPFSHLYAFLLSPSDHQLRAVPPLPFSVNTSVTIQHFRNASLLMRNKKTKLKRTWKLERELSRIRASIREAASLHRNDVVNVSVYPSSAAVHQCYFEMERRFKVYIYGEGDPPMVQNQPCNDIYTIEGRFIQEIERHSRSSWARNAEEAHIFLMPFSVTCIVKHMLHTISQHSGCLWIM